MFAQQTNKNTLKSPIKFMHVNDFVLIAVVIVVFGGQMERGLQLAATSDT